LVSTNASCSKPYANIEPGAAATPAAQAVNKCKTWCDNTDFPGSCRSDAANATGPCYECGPYAPPQPNPSTIEPKLCDGKCTDLKHDASNCGRCGNEVSSLLQTSVINLYY
jgi:hypothetical protein